MLEMEVKEEALVLTKDRPLVSGHIKYTKMMLKNVGTMSTKNCLSQKISDSSTEAQ